MDKILIICGPTATGKTDLAIKLAKKFNGELVSADSRQIYTGMDIGTGKDIGNAKKSKILSTVTDFKSQKFILNPYVIDAIPLWMLDIVKPNAEFSVVHYQYLCQKVIKNIISRGKLPIIVGGTGFYIQAIIKNSQTFSISPNLKLRQDLDKKDIPELQQILSVIDKRTWEQLNNSDRNNPRRLVRKIEIADYKSKNKITDLNSEMFDFLQIGLTTNTNFLYHRIDRRVEKRVIDGIEMEINNLMDSGYNWDIPAMNSMGYIEWKPWFNNPKDRTEVLRQTIIQKWKFDEHGYARRQMTWFKKQPDITWYDIQNNDVLKVITGKVSTWYN